MKYGVSAFGFLSAFCSRYRNPDTQESKRQIALTLYLDKLHGHAYNLFKPVTKSSMPGKFLREPLVLRSGKRNRLNGLLRAN